MELPTRPSEALEDEPYWLVAWQDVGQLPILAIKRGPKWFWADDEKGELLNIEDGRHLALYTRVTV